MKNATNQVLPIRVTVADDDLTTRSAVKHLLSGCLAVELAAAYADAQTAIRSLAADRASVLLLDMFVPGLNPLAALAKLRSKKVSSGFATIVIASFPSPNLLHASQRLGAAGWLGKPFTSEILVRAILAAQDAALLWPVLPSPTPSVNRFESPAAILAQAAREALFTGTNEPENLLAQADVARAVRYNAAELASFCELSSSTLHRLCLSHFRASPGRWLESLQIQEVARLLPCADLLREIAAQVGFNHQSSLARFVHRRLGLNPSALARTLAAETKGIAEEPRNRLA